LETVQDRT